MTNREIFYRHLGLPSFYPMDLEITKAEGLFFYDTDGRDYMDLVAGITVSNTGHRHPKVIEAIKNQADKYLHLNVYGEFIQSPQVNLAKRLTEYLPASLDSVYFVNSGSEAIEGALKLAKRFTGRHEIISFRNAYHGSTHGSLSILGNETLKNAFRPLLPGIRQIGFNQPSELTAITENTACVVLEVIQAEAGIIPGEPEFIRMLVEKCRRHQVMIIADDVQMGMGRTGRMFSFEHYDLIPDILVLAKAFGGGMPLGAFIASRKIMDTIAFNPELGHITTFGGHPVCCAAGLASLEILAEPSILGEVDEKGKLFEMAIKPHPAVKGIRRAGLALGIDLADQGKRELLMKKAISNGVIIDWYLFQPATFRIAPPLTITGSEIAEACRRLVISLDAIL
jgi:acetylornithine/succinyldiaminopimelate/putrescine aminotransferase